MPYAIRQDEPGWRTVDGEEDIYPNEIFSETFPIPALTKLQDTQWTKIKAERDRRQLEGGVQVNGHWFLSTERAMGEYNSMINASQGVAADTVLRQGWRTMGGGEVDMTPALARRILLAWMEQRCSIDDAAQAHRVAMEASYDPASYDFSGGWPKVFGEQ